MRRILYENIYNILSRYKEMLFLAGPRQSGKTTLAKLIAKSHVNSFYFNWDITQNKQLLLKNSYFYENINRKDNSKPLIIFDEIHKYNDWKNYLKGVFDRDKDNYHFLNSGSGRLDLFKKGGDSLAGRYLSFHLWPFTCAELSNKRIKFEEFLSNPLFINGESGEQKEIWKNLFLFSGFPEPFLKGNKRFYRLWSNSYAKQLIREDIQNFTVFKNIDNVEILYSILPSKIGNPVSISNIARDIKTSFDTIKSWLSIFQRFFILFSVSPWTKKISRAISKEKKLYLFDYANIESESARFENMIAVELLRAVNNWNDPGLDTFALHYLRNKQKEEVDFSILKENKPFLLVEAKLNDSNPSNVLQKFQNLLDVPAVQLVNKEMVLKQIKNNGQSLVITTASRWLAILP